MGKRKIDSGDHREYRDGCFSRVFFISEDGLRVSRRNRRPPRRSPEVRQGWGKSRTRRGVPPARSKSPFFLDFGVIKSISREISSHQIHISDFPNYGVPNPLENFRPGRPFEPSFSPSSWPAPLQHDPVSPARRLTCGPVA